MNSPRASKVTRRSLLASLGGIAGSAMVGQTMVQDIEAAPTGNHFRKMSDVQKEFERLLPLWQEERKQFATSSKTEDSWNGPYGKAIIALGPAVIPLLIQQVKSGDFWFNVPLALITKVDIANGKYVSEQANSKLWLEWWEAGDNEPPK